jgi:hypothetical protein
MIMAIMRRLLPLLGVIFWLGASHALAQDEETPAEKQYREDYELFQKIVAIKESAKRADGLLQFMKDRPDSKLDTYAQANYLRILEQLHTQSNWSLLVQQSERFVKIRPKVGESYFFLGAGLKQQNKYDAAMLALAKCYLLRCPASDKARQFLEVIYKGLHQGKTTGIDAIIKKARVEIAG